MNESVDEPSSSRTDMSCVTSPSPSPSPSVPTSPSSSTNISLSSSTSLSIPLISYISTFGLSQDTFASTGKGQAPSLLHRRLPASLLFRAPREDHATESGQPAFPFAIGQFTFPSDICIARARLPPHTHTFVLTMSTGARLYGITHTMYAKLPAEQLSTIRMQIAGNLIHQTDADVDELPQVLYVPQSVCVLMIQPFFDRVTIILEEMVRIHFPYSVATDAGVAAIYESLRHITVTPGADPYLYRLDDDRTISFYTPMITQPPLVDFDFSILFSSLEPSHIITVLECMISEFPIVVISQHVHRLTPAIEALISLLYPFEWSFIYIPLMPIMFRSIFDSPQPYLVGTVPQALQGAPHPENAVIVDLDANHVNLQHLDSTDTLRRLPHTLSMRLYHAITRHYNIYATTHPHAIIEPPSHPSSKRLSVGMKPRDKDKEIRDNDNIIHVWDGDSEDEDEQHPYLYAPSIIDTSITTSTPPVECECPTGYHILTCAHYEDDTMSRPHHRPQKSLDRTLHRSRLPHPPPVLANNIITLPPALDLPSCSPASTLSYAIKELKISSPIPIPSPSSHPPLHIDTTQHPIHPEITLQDVCITSLSTSSESSRSLEDDVASAISSSTSTSDMSDISTSSTSTSTSITSSASATSASAFTPPSSATPPRTSSRVPSHMSRSVSTDRFATTHPLHRFLSTPLLTSDESPNITSTQPEQQSLSLHRLRRAFVSIWVKLLCGYRQWDDLLRIATPRKRISMITSNDVDVIHTSKRITPGDADVISSSITSPSLRGLHSPIPIPLPTEETRMELDEGALVQHLVIQLESITSSTSTSTPSVPPSPLSPHDLTFLRRLCSSQMMHHLMDSHTYTWFDVLIQRLIQRRVQSVCISYLCDVVKEQEMVGSMMKQGAIIPSWKERWFVLSDDSLRYYRPTQQLMDVEMRYRHTRTSLAHAVMGSAYLQQHLEICHIWIKQQFPHMDMPEIQTKIISSRIHVQPSPVKLMIRIHPRHRHPSLSRFITAYITSSSPNHDDITTYDPMITSHDYHCLMECESLVNQLYTDRILVERHRRNEKGCISLVQGMSVSILSSPSTPKHGEYEYGMEIISEKRRMLLLCDSINKRQAWIDAITTRIPTSSPSTSTPTFTKASPPLSRSYSPKATSTQWFS